MILDVGVYTICHTCNIFWLFLILLSAGSSFGSYNLVRRLKGCSPSAFVFVTRVTFATTFTGYAGIIIYYVDKNEIYAFFESKNLQIAGRNTSFSGRKIIKTD